MIYIFQELHNKVVFLCLVIHIKPVKYNKNGFCLKKNLKCEQYVWVTKGAVW